MAYKSRHQDNNGDWISVDDKLPKDYEYVLAAVETSSYDGAVPSVQMLFRRDGGWVRTVDQYRHTSPIRYWTPLPTPPIRKRGDK